MAFFTSKDNLLALSPAIIANAQNGTETTSHSGILLSVTYNIETLIHVGKLV
ncbi:MULTISPECIES: hypothetical protein [unclassified Saccharibacter]|uniref:hypothetical protein n=1 Tax=unclassified Saccharibacter TaxID=2648722 RepID=UPI001324ADBB|nr:MULTISPECIES: hypothetical protein [unclassified Saccharibacter]MXV36993.1 hypothetical protein [Saccharibacter sp. EH611]MXV58517.1 hypothetical protein [Saccharibacter sp. EH70]MXV66023.1 hypothetical protein [Saccharibacter sp. EH60]